MNGPARIPSPPLARAAVAPAPAGRASDVHRDRLDEATRRARRAGRDVAVRLVETLPADAPWPAPESTSGARVFAWDGADLSIRAFGSVPGFDANSDDALRMVAAHAVGFGDGLPAWVGGRSHTRALGRPPWEGWPGALYWLPSHLMLRTPEHVRAIRHVLVRPDGSLWHGPRWRRASARPWSPRVGTWTALDSRADFDAWIDAAQQRMAAGDLHKVVLARRVRLDDGAGASAEATFEALGTGAGQVRYFVSFPGAGALVGSTPETLLTLDGRTLRTEALAGTATATEAAGLADRIKDRAEHEWVVEALRCALAPAARSVEVGALQARVFGGLAHLQTPLHATLRDEGRPLDWIDRLHPTPAVAGWPTEAAARFIAEIEPGERGWYAGALGWTDGGHRGHAVVALRCGLFRPEQTLLFAGAGVVRASEADLEWGEIELKLRRMAQSLAGPA